jgi:hypothetical protein
MNQAGMNAINKARIERRERPASPTLKGIPMKYNLSSHLASIDRSKTAPRPHPICGAGDNTTMRRIACLPPGPEGCGLGLGFGSFGSVFLLGEE